ncbi:MAG TPA: phage holin family protein, partial [Cytophagaceae bacterium]
VVLACAHFLPAISVANFWTAVVVALVLTFLNMLVKPILVVLTIPITIFTLGLFLLVINAIIILMADGLVGGFEVDGFFWALIFSLILSFANSLIENLLDE